MDTIKRVQDLMQERDMNLCVLTKKCGLSYSTIESTALQWYEGYFSEDSWQRDWDDNSSLSLISGL